MENWQRISWIEDFATFFKVETTDVKTIFEVFLGDRANSWSHPFGELSPWVQHWESETSMEIRNEIKSERGWNWNNVGAKILQNEIYRRTCGAASQFQHLKGEVLKYKQRVGRDIHLLDYGCGTSNFIDHIVNESGIYFDIWETDPIAVEYCKHKYRNIPNVTSCNLIPSPNRYSGDACRVPTLPVHFNTSYDVVYTMDVLEHTLDPLSILISLVDSIRPDGLLCFNYPDNIEGDWHTPEANYMRPFCLLYVNLLFTQQDVLVFTKSCKRRAEQMTKYAAKLFNAVVMPSMKKKAEQYLANTTYAEKYNLI